MNIPSHAALDLSYVIPLYFDQDNSDSLNDLLYRYAAYDASLMDRVQFVLVDDGSPRPVMLPPDLDLNVLLLRIREDIAWNQGGARNLGVLYSRCDKVIATDLDHEFSEETLARIVSMRPLGKRMYRMHRKDVDGRFMRPHPNTFVMSRGRFLELFGVDEDFSGHYCCEDGMFWRWQRYNGTRFRYLSKRYVNQSRVIDRAGSYHSLSRDTTHNTDLKKRKIREWDRWGFRGGHSRKFLAFTWDMVEDRLRSRRTWQVPEDRWWKKTWIFRQLRCR